MTHLYVICYEEILSPVDVKAHMEYVHAESAGHARMIFRQMQPDYTRFRIVNAGLAIGHFCDFHGEGRTADVMQRHVIA